jgi:hypothetical protein
MARIQCLFRQDASCWAIRAKNDNTHAFPFFFSIAQGKAEGLLRAEQRFQDDGY